MADLNAQLEADVLSVAGTRVASVLEQAARFLIERGWTPQDRYQPGGPLTALRAITEAVHEAGAGRQITALHMACLDAVTLDIFGERCGLGNASVSRWERRPGHDVDSIVRLIEAVARKARGQS